MPKISFSFTGAVDNAEITKAIDLYINYKEAVDNCIFHNICTIPVVQEEAIPGEQCTL